jgi:hypothetical protein
MGLSNAKAHGEVRTQFHSRANADAMDGGQWNAIVEAI